MFNFNNVIIDGLNLAFRAQNAAPFLSTATGTPTGPLTVMLNMLGKIRKDNPGANIYFVWDGSPQRRMSLSTQYKSNRPPGRAAAKAELPRLLTALGIHQAKNPDEEADDVVYTLAKTLTGTTVIVSTDRDLLQCCTLTTILQTGTAKKPHWYDAGAVKEEFGVPPEKFALYRCFVGDESDCIQGVPRMLKRLAASLVLQHESVVAIYAALPTVKLTKKQAEALQQHRTAVEANEALCRLVQVPYGVVEGQLDRTVVEDVLAQLEINVKVVKPFFEVPRGFRKVGVVRSNLLEELNGKLPDTDRPLIAGEPLDDECF